MKKNTPYLIKWNDHYSTNGFLKADLTDIVDEVVFTSVGLFIKQDKLHYHFAQTIGKDVAADSLSLLKAHIIFIKELV